jgi:hypothetical protein
MSWSLRMVELGLLCFCMVIPRLFIKESMLDAALVWFFLGMLKLYCWCVHFSLVGSIYLYLSACGSFVSCMGLHELACVFTFFLSWSVLGISVWPCMLRGGRAWFPVSAWSLHGLSFNLAGWKLLIGYGSFSGCDDERALHALACGLICLVI